MWHLKIRHRVRASNWPLTRFFKCRFDDFLLRLSYILFYIPHSVLLCMKFSLSPYIYMYTYIYLHILYTLCIKSQEWIWYAKSRKICSYIFIFDYLERTVFFIHSSINFSNTRPNIDIFFLYVFFIAAGFSTFEIMYLLFISLSTAVICYFRFPIIIFDL